mgnify:CR=1 FL=1
MQDMTVRATLKAQNIRHEEVTLGRLRRQNINQFKAATGQVKNVKSFLANNSLKVAVMGFGATLFLILA